MSSEWLYHRIALTAWSLIAVGTGLLLFFVTAPYGRHTRTGWGPTLDPILSWVLMEAASPILMAALFLAGNRRSNAVAIVLLAMWELHYVNRSFIFPLRKRGHANRIPAVVITFGWLFNAVNAYFNGRHLFLFSRVHDPDWLLDPRFLAGAAMFVFGFVVNISSDEILLNLRSSRSSGYRIPHGGLFRWVSCPNYLGEIMEWSGWALATWSLAGLSFALWTAANLVPRARSNHRWYQDEFSNYPSRRKALIPYLY